MSGVLGVGVDIVEVDRIRELLERKGDRLKEMLFTDREWEDSKGRCERLAARFAAKEAVAKALGTGIRGMSWRDIEITRDGLGKPQVRLRGGALQVAGAKGVSAVLISLSHTQRYAVAFAVACGGEPVEACNFRRDAGDRQEGDP